MRLASRSGLIATTLAPRLAKDRGRTTMPGRPAVGRLSSE